MLLCDYLQDWLRARSADLKPRTVESYASLIRLHIAPRIGSIPVCDLRSQHIKSALQGIRGTGRQRTAEACYVLLHTALDGVDHNPMQGVKRPRHKQQSPPAWSDVCIAAYMDALIDHPHRLPLTLCIVLGLRRGEACGLRWSDIDLQAQTIHIRNQRYRLDSGEIVDGTPKSDASIRDLPIPPQLLPLLKSSSHVGTYLCTVTPSGLNAAHRRLVRRLHLPYTTLHGLRHSMATSCIRHGGDMRSLQLILGHASYTTTADKYTHPDCYMLQTAIDRAIQPCYNLSRAEHLTLNQGVQGSSP